MREVSASVNGVLKRFSTAEWSFDDRVVRSIQLEILEKATPEYLVEQLGKKQSAHASRTLALHLRCSFRGLLEADQFFVFLVPQVVAEAAQAIAKCQHFDLLKKWIRIVACL